MNKIAENSTLTSYIVIHPIDCDDCVKGWFVIEYIVFRGFGTHPLN